MAVEIDGHHRHLQLLDQANDVGLPQAVLDAEVRRDFRHRPSREKAQRVTVFHMAERGGDTLHRHGALGGVVAGEGIHGNEVGAHGTDVVQNHIHHHLEVGTIFTDDFNQHNAVERTEWVVRHGDKPTVFRQIFQHFLATNVDGDVEVAEQTLHKWHARGVAVVVVNPVHLIHCEQAEQAVHQLLLALEEGGELANIVVVEHCALDRRLCAGVLLRLVVLHS